MFLQKKIKSRFFNSLELLNDAAQIAYQAFFFDNTDKSELIVHFKGQGETAVCDEIDLKKFRTGLKNITWTRNTDYCKGVDYGAFFRYPLSPFYVLD